MKLLVAFIAAACILSGVCSAAESPFDAVDTESIEGALTGEAADMLEDIHIDEDIDLEQGMDKILDYSRQQAGGIIKRALKSAVTIFLIAVLAAFCDSLGKDLAPEGMPNWAVFAAVAAISAVALGDVQTFIGLGSETVARIDALSRAVMPSLSAIAAAGGAITSATAKYAVAAAFIGILITLANDLIMPLVYGYLAVVIANAAMGEAILEGIAKLLKWAATTLLTGITLIFTTYLSLSGILASVGDAAGLKLTKSALSAALPVVGGIVSDAAGTIMAGMNLLKSAVGIFGTLAVAAVCILPFLKLGVHYIAYKAAARLTEMTVEGRLSKLISGIGSAFGIVMGLTGSCALMLLFSIISIVKAAGG